MLVIRNVNKQDIREKAFIDKIVSLHIQSFGGFFLSTLHPGFLRQLYKSFVTYKQSALLVALMDDVPIGFIAYSYNTTGMYKFMLFRYFFQFVWYSFLSFLKKPSIFAKMFSALSMPYSYAREEEYVKVFSLGVAPEYQKHGIGSKLMQEMKNHVDFTRIGYITLETDALNNERANNFYAKNGFRLSQEYITFEGRKMNKYHYRSKYENIAS